MAPTSALARPHRCASGFVNRRNVHRCGGELSGGSSPPRPTILCKIAYSSRMAKTVPFSDARAHLTELLDEIEEIREHVVITRNGRPAVVVMSEAEYESLMETLEVLSDSEVMAALKASDEDVAAGRVSPWDEVKRDLGLA